MTITSAEMDLIHEWREAHDRAVRERVDALEWVARLRAELLDRVELLEDVLRISLLDACPTCGGGWIAHDVCEVCPAWGGNGGPCDSGYYTTCPVCGCGGDAP